ncbi:helix-hairpin-helix domain-containing protein [Microvirga sp. BT290]|uniref:Helix-hairpin-helix domain-containing protein n=2 Tax=Microvirga terrestris TaxID=2791024 RepID=A0ABS0HQ30_9HYPH|nr:helix-hairpin-helix domain-containing protein [Microvirga terrestris]
MITAAPPQILAGEKQLVEVPHRDERVQVADADPATSMATSSSRVEASYLPASGPQDIVSAPMATDLLPLAGEQASAALESTVSAPPADIDMTGAVAKHASLAVPASPLGPVADLVDLNRASVEQLNSLKGAGALGRAIIKHRPYRSVDDLVKRKIVRRTVFEKIKGQVTVR